MNNNMMLFSGNSMPEFTQSVSGYLRQSMGSARVSQFRDGEIDVEIESNVRGYDVFVIQSTCKPTHQHLMELILLVDALRRSSPARITAVIPYFGYARQDRRARSARVPISAKVVADMVDAAGVDRVVTVDLHADQIQGFFNVPVENLYATPVLVDDLNSRGYQNAIVVSPDVGGVVRARALAKSLNDLDLAIIDKRRPRTNATEVMNIIGEVGGKTCIMVDDIVDTAGTLCSAAEALKNSGAEKVVAYCTHAVLSPPAIETIQASCLDELVITDTIPLSEEATQCKTIRVVSIVPVLGEAIRRISNEESISAMFP